MLHLQETTSFKDFVKLSYGIVFQAEIDKTFFIREDAHWEAVENQLTYIPFSQVIFLKGVQCLYI